MARHTRKKISIPFRHRKKLTRWQKIKRFLHISK